MYRNDEYNPDEHKRPSQGRNMVSLSTVGGGVRTKQPPSNIFKINPVELKELFNVEEQQTERLQKLRGHGNVQGVLQKLQSEQDSGIMGDRCDIHRRQNKFDQNKKPTPKRPPFSESVKDALNDRLIILVAIFAIISIIPGMIVNAAKGWQEGVFICVALFIQVLITAYSDYVKDNKFVELQTLNRNESLPVLRGKAGSTQTISCWDLVVGDVVLLAPGDKLPADCILIDSANLRVKEFTKIEDEQDDEDAPSKFSSVVKQKTVDADPFLFTDSFVLGGTGKALVACVGEHSSRGGEDTRYDTSEKVTELTTKLDAIGGSLRFFGLLSAIIILGTSIVVLCIQAGVSEEETVEIGSSEIVVSNGFGGDDFTNKLCNCFIIALVMLIVSVPEGLPMTIVVSLAYSVLLMFEHDNILVRDLESVEEVGQIQDLCLGKTGTMTTEDMEVVNFYTQDIFVTNARKNTFLNCELDPTIQDKIIESVVYNNQAYIEMTENSFYVPVGQGTEVSMIKWLQSAEIPVHEIMAHKANNVLAQVPFDSKLKRSIIAVRHPQMADTVRVYVKGAPEEVLRNCASHFISGDKTETGYRRAEKMPLDEQTKADILTEKMENGMAINSLRAIALSYRDYSEAEFQIVLDGMKGDVDTKEEIAQLEQDQTFLALVALRDPIRENVKDVISNCQKSSVTVKLISGDNLLTTIAVARDVGILNEHEFNECKSKGDDSNVAMHASRFREICGEVVRRTNIEEEGEEETTTYTLNEANQIAFNGIIGNLKVIGRAEPEDKLRLIAGLKGLRDDNELVDDEEEGAETQGHKVAVVGEGINDIDAFEAADVSFAVGSGTSYARNKASMVLTTNDFDSCMRAVMWGRNIYVNVQRFLQFQMTANLAVIVVVLVSTITMTESCLNPVQLIWINLIMDILGAIGLASTRPHTEIVAEPHGHGNVMTPYMYRQIFGAAIYMVAIMMIVMYGGKSFFELPYSNSDNVLDSTIGGENKREHFTLIFNTFIFLQFFNLINCRDVSAHKMHGFSQLWRNFTTIMVLAIILAIQVLACLTSIFYPIFEVSKQTTREFVITLVSAASLLLANALLKFIPERWLGKMPALNEEKAVGSENALMKGFDNHAKAKAFKKGGAQPKNHDGSYESMSDRGSQNSDEDDGFRNA